MTDLYAKIAEISQYDEGEVKVAMAKMPYGDVLLITDLQDSKSANDHHLITFLIRKYRDAELTEWESHHAEYPWAFTSLEAPVIREIFECLGVKYHQSGDDFYVKEWSVMEKIVKKNPIARDMALSGKYRAKATPTRKEREGKNDPWDRNAKRKDSKMDDLNEGMMGMSGIPAINRMRALAGLPEVSKTEAPMEPMGFDDEPLPGDMDDAEELPEIRTAVVSDAMSEIQTSINAIQRRLSDIRMGEYRTLVKKLDDLQTQVRAMGADYLGGE